VGRLLDAVAKDRQPRQLSCTPPPTARAGGLGGRADRGHRLVYAAVMEGDRSFPAG
jgi:hypothetical protein